MRPFGIPAGRLEATPPLWPRNPASPRAQALSDAMLDCWTSFARSARPQAANGPDWPAFGTVGTYMHFTDAPHPQTRLLPGMYQLNEDVVCRRLAAGNLPWNWNVGVGSPKLPPQAGGCR